MNYYYLEIIRGIETGRRYQINEGATSIGRSASNTLALHPSEKSVSSHHAILYRNGEQIILQDMQSTNGTYFNDEKIQERELKPGDIIGFGQKGPRLKLIVTESQLSENARPASQAVQADTSPTIKNSVRALDIKSTDTTETPTAQSSGSRQKKDPFAAGSASMTIDMENKLLQNELDAESMNALMKDGKRLEKIVNRGNINDMQSSLLTSAYKARKKTHKHWIVIVSIIGVVSLVVISVLTVRMLQYKYMLDKGLTLESKLDTYEKKIFQANADPQKNKSELARLVKELEDTKKQLSTVKGQLDEQDVEKFYEDDVERFINDIMIRLGESDYHIPPNMVERVKYHIAQYSGSLKGTIGRYLKRKQTYFPMIKNIFKQEKIPLELAYVSMLESGFNPNALSHAGARGLWQFMPKTGQQYHLRVDDIVDERCDPEKATYAAAKYLKKLIAIFGSKSSIMLAVASYNTGEGNMIRALSRIDDPIRNRDFWYLYRMGYLAEETNEYIPRILALMIIDEHPEKYGFTSDNSTPITPEDEKENDFIELGF